MKVFICIVKTESMDKYPSVHKNKPNILFEIEKVWKLEGEIESLKWYIDTSSFEIYECELEE